jgi:hypothetical protein
MSNEYTPEPGQILYGYGMSEFECPTYVDAFIQYLLSDYARIYWNHFQESFELDGYRPENPDSTILAVDDLTVRGYWWGDESAPEATLPNLSFKGVDIYWYKHPGRGQSTNIEKTPQQWVAWFEQALAAIQRADSRLD